MVNAKSTVKGVFRELAVLEMIKSFRNQMNSRVHVL